MDILIKVLQFLLSFSLLVLVHESGHFIFARIFGVRVERFRIFFGRPLIKWKWGETEFGIGWLPFGGYAKLSGMIDESLDSGSLRSEPQKWEFRSRPVWQRLLMMLGGVIMNVIFAFIIYVGISYTWGDSYISNSDMKYGYVFNDVGHSLGFRDGDKIISIGSRPVEDFSKIMTSILIESDNTTVVERDGVLDTIAIPTQSVMKFIEQPDFIEPRYPFVVESVIGGMGAASAGLQKGDRLTSADGVPTLYFDQYRKVFSSHAGDTVRLGFDRGGRELFADVFVSPAGMIGVNINKADFISIRTRHYTLLQSVPQGFVRVGTEMSDYWKQLKLIVKPKTEMYKALGGPLSIGNIFPPVWSWEHFWRITALLSVIFAVMNVLPIPALDGGHVLFLLVEMITRRKPSDNFLMYAQLIGMTILIALMILVTKNDISRIFFH